MIFYKIVASFGGVGMIKKGGGTVAALILCVGLYFGVVFHLHSHNRLLIFSLITLLVGVFVSNEVERIWGKDSNKIVIDEVLGMAISLLFLPINVKTLIIGFILFRFFDIVKPLYIKKTESLRGGWGVMLDDVVAGVYANVIIQILILTHLLL